MNTIADSTGLWIKRAPFGSGVSVESPLPQSLADEIPALPPSEAVKQTVETIAQFSDFAALLRTFGAIAVIAAMSAFLLQGWSAGSDVSRYYIMLAQSVLLALGGCGLSFVMKENKGARVFLGLSLISITTDMATLGALIYSLTQWDGGLRIYPTLAHWQATNGQATLLAALAGVAVLIPIALFAFMVLARRSAKPLAGLSLLANLMLLVPVRESLLVGGIAMLGVLLPVIGYRRLMAQDATLRTREGYFAAASLIAPVVIVIIRSLWLYPVDAGLALMLELTGFLLLRTLAPLAGKRTVLDFVLGLGSCLMAWSAGLSLSSLVGATGTLSYLIFGVVSTALSLDVAMRSGNHKRSFATLAAWVLAISQCIPVFLYNDAVSLLDLLMAGIAVGYMGKLFARRSLLLLGFLMSAGAGAQQVWRVIELIDLSRWMTLAILGAGAIVAASVVERHGVILKLKWKQLCDFGKAQD